LELDQPAGIFVRGDVTVLAEPRVVNSQILVHFSNLRAAQIARWCTSFLEKPHGTRVSTYIEIRLRARSFFPDWNRCGYPHVKHRKCRGRLRPSGCSFSSVGARKMRSRAEGLHSWEKPAEGRSGKVVGARLRLAFKQAARLDELADSSQSLDFFSRATPAGDRPVDGSIVTGSVAGFTGEK
jgi:hypothetical protein